MRKLVLIIFGLFLTALILEAALRLAGFTYLAWQDYQNSRALKEADKGEYRILCVGESTTAFGGENSYPKQLERILNQRSSERKFVVINKGIPAIDTAVILSDLEHNLNRYSPRMVIAMMGINDSLESLRVQVGFISKSRDFIKSLRIYKVLRLAWSGVAPGKRLKKAYFESGKYHLERQHYYEARQLFEKAMRIQPADPADYLWLGKCYYEQGLKAKAEEMFDKTRGMAFSGAQDYIDAGWGYFDIGMVSRAEEMFYKAIEFKPDDYGSYVETAQFYHDAGSFQKAERMYKKALELAGPQSRDSWPYSAFGWHYFELNKFAEAERMFKEAMERDSRDPEIYLDLGYVKQAQGDLGQAEAYFKRSGLGDSRIKAFTSRNYNRLKDIVLGRGIKLVCVQYPMRGIRDLREMFNFPEGIVWVDNQQSFKEALTQAGYDDYFTDRFAGDFGHCAPKGNNLLANNIAQAIIKEYFSDRQ